MSVSSISCDMSFAGAVLQEKVLAMSLALSGVRLMSVTPAPCKMSASAAAFAAIMGKPYTSDQMEETINSALNYGAKKLDIYFMVGLSGQNQKSVLDSIEYSRYIYNKFNNRDKIFTFISPMAPFLDAGSIVYENPEPYGFTKLYHSLRDHRDALHNPSWKLYLSYYTKWMTRDEIAEITYEAMIRMNKLKIDVGITESTRGSAIQTGLEMARDIMRKIDSIFKTTNDQVIHAIESPRNWVVRFDCEDRVQPAFHGRQFFLETTWRHRFSVTRLTIRRLSFASPRWSP